MKCRQVVCTALLLAFGCSALFAAATREEFESQVKGTMARLNAEAIGSEGPSVLAGLIQSEYSAPIEEMEWAVSKGLPWGAIAAFAYIRATTGESFAVLSSVSAEKDLWSHAEKAGMNADKMSRSLERLLKLAQQERNTRIFERLRMDRRVSRMPDLGSGFGLLQETLDFRRLETPRPTKVHTQTP
jgi:hypothetical protein